MTYVPIKTVTILRSNLLESNDLTLPLSYFQYKDAFLVVEQNRVKVVLDLAKIFLKESGLNMSAPIVSALTGRFSDLFIIKYRRDDIPLKNQHGYYDNNIKVLNPISYKDYRVSYTSMNTPNVVDVPAQKGFLDDLVISGGRDLSNSLVAVNGVFHKTSLFQNKLYVHDGFRTIRINNKQDVTLIDTSDVGGHSIIPLTSSNVSLNTYNGEAIVSVGTSLKNKTVFFVIDGYFHHIDNDIFYFLDDSHLAVKTALLVLTSQFRHNPRTLYRRDLLNVEAPQQSRKYSDAYANLFVDQRTVPASTFTTKEFQLSRLQHYHSFLVVMNTPSLFSISTDLVPTSAPQFYNAMGEVPLTGMMSYSAGLCPTYVIKNDPFGRKSIFTPPLDYDVDYQDTTKSPALITSLLEEPGLIRNPPCRLVDYISA